MSKVLHVAIVIDQMIIKRNFAPSPVPKYMFNNMQYLNKNCKALYEMGGGGGVGQFFNAL